MHKKTASRHIAVCHVHYSPQFTHIVPFFCMFFPISSGYYALIYTLCHPIWGCSKLNPVYNLSTIAVRKGSPALSRLLQRQRPQPYPSFDCHSSTRPCGETFNTEAISSPPLDTNIVSKRKGQRIPHSVSEIVFARTQAPILTHQSVYLHLVSPSVPLPVVPSFSS
jgi:hypothetical protein